MPTLCIASHGLVCANGRQCVKNAQVPSGALTLRWTAKRYTEEHEVISYNDATSVGRLHITEYASKSLGDVVFVELPKKGREVGKGGEEPNFSLYFIEH